MNKNSSDPTGPGANGHTTSELGQLVELRRDVVAPGSRGLHYIGLEHVEAATGRVLAVANADKVKSNTFAFQPGDVLYGRMRPYLNKVVLASESGVCSTEFFVLRPREGVDSTLLSRVLRQPDIVAFASERMSGDLPRIQFDDLASYELTLPTDEDDQRAVGQFIHACDEWVRTLTDRIDAARRGLVALRVATLRAACAGELSAEYRADHPTEDASELVRRIAGRRKRRKVMKHSGQSVEVPHEIPDGWCWAAVGDLVDVATGATPLRGRSAYYGGAIPWVTSGAVNAGLITEVGEYITDKALEETNAKVFPKGTLLVAMYGEGQTRGRVAELGISAATNQAVAALVFDSTSAPLRDYLRLFFEHKYLAVRASASGGVQANLSLTTIKKIMVPVAPPNERRYIIKRVREVEAQTAALIRRIELVEKALERVRSLVASRALAASVG